MKSSDFVNPPLQGGFNLVIVGMVGEPPPGLNHLHYQGPDLHKKFTVMPFDFLWQYEVANKREIADESLIADFKINFVLSAFQPLQTFFQGIPKAGGSGAFPAGCYLIKIGSVDRYPIGPMTG